MATDAPAKNEAKNEAKSADKKAAPIVVVAVREGTYPRPGETYPIFRSQGEVFPLHRADDFSEEWMRKVAPGEHPTLEREPAPVPQTTAPRIKAASPFPPLQ